MRTALALLAAAALVVALSGRESPVNAQPGKVAAPEVGRYQISAFGAMAPGGIQSGAYILDTATSEVFLVRDRGEPASLGSVPKGKK